MGALDRCDLRQRVQEALDAFLAVRRPRFEAMGVELAPLSEALEEFLAGGKRLRPGFCFWGHLGAGGKDSDDLVVAAASLELFQACAIIHDDVMDGSDTRRGKPAVHKRFAALHSREGWSGSDDAFGAGAAILLGDLCLAWSDEMLMSSGLTSPAALAVFDQMRAELMGTRSSSRCTSAPPSPTHRSRCVPPTRRTGCRSVRPSSSGTTCSASSATPLSPASRQVTTCGRASAP
jgi:geranylgeranyl diphosphate synthase type I